MVTLVRTRHPQRIPARRAWPACPGSSGPHGWSVDPRTAYLVKGIVHHRAQRPDPRAWPSPRTAVMADRRLSPCSSSASGLSRRARPVLRTRCGQGGSGNSMRTGRFGARAPTALRRGRKGKAGHASRRAPAARDHLRSPLCAAACVVPAWRADRLSSCRPLFWLPIASVILKCRKASRMRWVAKSIRLMVKRTA